MAISNKTFKGTKGEWRVETPTGYNGFLYIKNGNTAWDTTCATCHNPLGLSDDEEELTANAKLIAAAPELLAELRKVRLDIKLHNSFREDSPIVKGIDYVINKAL